MNSTSDTRHSVTDWQKMLTSAILLQRAMASLDMTAGLGTTLRGSELDKAFSGPRNASGQRHGRGTYRFPNQFYRYEGDFVHGEAHGRGRLSMADGGYYEGDFANDEITGSGERLWSDGRKYVGAFDMGEMHGPGTLTFPDGATFTGGFERNARVGRGALVARDGSRYDGEWAFDKRHGKGVETVAATGERYEGDFERGKRHGRGAWRVGDGGGDTYEGEWRDGRRHGRGAAFDAASGASYAGAFEADRPVDLPAFLELEILGPVPEDGGERPKLGTEEAPLAATAGRALGEGGAVARLRARAPPPPLEARAVEADVSAAETPAETQPHTSEALPGEGADSAPGALGVLGDVATHESGRVFRCVLTRGAPAVAEPPSPDAGGAGDAGASAETHPEEQGGMEPDAIEDGASAEVSYVYGPEIPWADPGSNPLGFDAAFTEKGEASLAHVALPKTLEAGAYCVVVRDATPGKYGDFGRCPEKHFVLQVEAALEPEETGGGAEGDAAEA